MTRMRRVNTCTREPNGEMYDPEHSGQIKTGGEWAWRVPSASRVQLRRHPPTPSTHALIWHARVDGPSAGLARTAYHALGNAVHATFVIALSTPCSDECGGYRARLLASYAPLVR
jgi:hypothetical protein